jgi:hypothetical protein
MYCGDKDLTGTVQCTVNCTFVHIPTGHGVKWDTLGKGENMSPGPARLGQPKAGPRLVLFLVCSIHMK